MQANYVDQVFLDNLNHAIMTEERQLVALEREVRDLQGRAKKGEFYVERMRKEIAERERRIQLCSDLNRMQAYESKKRYLQAKITEVKAKTAERLQAASSRDMQLEAMKRNFTVARPKGLRTGVNVKSKKPGQRRNQNTGNGQSLSSDHSDF